MRTLKKERKKVNELYQQGLTASLLCMCLSIALTFFEQYWVAILLFFTAFIEVANTLNYLEIRNEFDDEIKRRRKTWTI